jgi:hypothetical protein
MKSELQNLREYSAKLEDTLQTINNKCNWLLAQKLNPAQKNTIKEIKELLKLV